jgi:elongation factor G
MAREDGRAAAEASEELMNKYLEGEELTRAEIVKALRDRTIACEIQPMLCGTAFKNKGVQRMLDAVIDFLPSPVDIPPVKGVDEATTKLERKADDNEKFSALAFKIMTDPFVGQLTFFRVYSGVINRATPCTTRSREEGASRPYSADARQPARRNQGSAGRRHRRRVGLKDATTGDTLCDPAARSCSSAWCSRSR